MKKVLHTLTLLLVFATYATAQAPWRAKLYFHFTDSNNTRYTDTLWFGFDQAGDISYQPGLDELDTAIRYNRAYIDNPFINAELNTWCGNMRKDIREFKKRETIFDFYAYGNLKSISYDSTDFIYLIDSVDRISQAYINTINFDIRSAHRNQHFIVQDAYETINGQIRHLYLVNSRTKIEDFVTHSFTQCYYPTIDRGDIFHLNLLIYYGWWVGATEHDKTSLDIKIHPNPSTGLFQLTNLPAEQNISISINGIDGRILSEYDLQQNESVIDLSNYEAGVYYAVISNNVNNSARIYKNFKLIKY